MEGKHRVIHVLFTFLLRVQSTLCTESIDPVEFLLSKDFPKNKSFVPLPSDFQYSGDHKTDCCSLVLWVNIKDWRPPDLDYYDSGEEPPEVREPQIGHGVITFKLSHPQIRDGDDIFSMNYVKNVMGQVKERFIINFDKCVSITDKVFSIYASTNIVDMKDIRIVIRHGKDMGVNCEPQLNSDPIQFLLSKNYPRQKMVPYVDMMNRCELVLKIEIQSIEKVGSGAPPLTEDDIVVESGPVYFDFKHPNFENEKETVEVYFSLDKGESRKKQSVCFSKCTNIDQKTLSLYAHTRITEVMDVKIITYVGQQKCTKHYEDQASTYKSQAVIFGCLFAICLFICLVLLCKIFKMKYNADAAAADGYEMAEIANSKVQNDANYLL